MRQGCWARRGPGPKTGRGKLQQNRRSLSADFLRKGYFGGGVESAGGGGVAVPLLLDESGGGFVDESAGGGVLCMEFEDELESGEAGAVVEESVGALGDVDCCLEQATIASALRHNKRRLRFIDHLTVYLSIWLSI